MTTLLHIDASARPGRSGTDPYGSHTRRLTARFVDHWMQLAPDTQLRYRDIGAMPPAPVTGAWIHAAFTPADRREPWMVEVLKESDELVDERSEERRVGKECRSRWSEYHYKQKNRRHGEHQI